MKVKQMANRYASLYLNDVLNKVKEVAIETMLSPHRCIIGDTNGDSTAVINDRIAQRNEGIRELARALIRELVKMTEEEEK